MLVEVHVESELETALEIDADVIGINNRDLGDFSVDIDRTYALLSDVPAGKTVVSESGFRTREDLEALEDVGVDAVLVGESLMRPGSRRACDPALAAGIARRLRRRTQLVGVFVNPTLDEVALAADTIGLTHLQLHGDEGPSFCVEAGRRTGCRVIKAVRVRGGADLHDLERYRLADLHLLDAWSEGARGGTGQTWDWSLLARRRQTVPAILSGGLTPDNVAAGIAAVRPWAVDVASGVEASPGIKDPARLEAFLAAVAGAGAHAGLPSGAPAETSASGAEPGGAPAEAEAVGSGAASPAQARSGLPEPDPVVPHAGHDAPPSAAHPAPNDRG